MPEQSTGQHVELPLDPDPAATGPGSTGLGSTGPGPAGRPVHLQPRFLTLVIVGGTLGTPARYAVGLALPTRPGGWPTGTLLCNLLGALLLGALLEALLRAGPDTGRRRLVRLAAGTGFLGAFTTYSTLAVETDLLVRSSRPVLAAVYAAGTVLGGLALSATGIGLAAVRHRRRHRPGLPLDPDSGAISPARRPA